MRLHEGRSQTGKGMTRFEISRAVDNQAFVERCLKSSRSFPGFYDDVPAKWKFKENDWNAEQGEKAGMDKFRTGCTAVFQAKIDFCRIGSVR
jgi:hypothetical protein